MNGKLQLKSTFGYIKKQTSCYAGELQKNLILRKKFSFIKKFGQLSFLRISCRVKTPKVKIVKFTAFQLMKFKTLSAKSISEPYREMCIGQRSLSQIFQIVKNTFLK